MIYKGKDLILDVLEFTQIKRIYKGSQLVWRAVYNAIRSCFGSGVWYSDKPWLGSETWKNN